MSNYLPAGLFMPVPGEPGIFEAQYEIEVNIGPFASVLIPKGHRTNFATTPKLPNWIRKLPILGWLIAKIWDWLLDPMNPDWQLAAVIHDGLVGEWSRPIGIINRPIDRNGMQPIEVLVDWDRAANIFKKVMFMTGAHPLKRFFRYWGVRVYGTYKELKL